MTEDTSQAPKDMIGFLDYYFVKKAPFQIPAAGREWIVQFGPWIAVVLLVISLPVIFVLLGLGMAWVPYGPGYGYAYGFWYWPWMLGFVIHVVLMGLALPGLFARKMSGWTLMFYAQLISAISSLFSMAIISGLIGALISFYILFQIRSLYKT